MSEQVEYVDTPGRRRVRKCGAVAAVVIYFVYLVYRGLYTLNPDALAFSLAVYFAEVHGFLSLVFYFFQIWDLRKRTPPAIETALSVDVFITTFDEDVELLRQTVRGAIAMRHPHRTFVLDDGRRLEVAALCRELGAEYIARSDSRDAKAGNWNHAFARTSADVIATFDADHVPRADFLERTLGFFNDPKVAVVQVPQRYHNLDSLQHRVSWRTRRLYGEQDVFFNLVMPGKDRWGAAFFCGTGAVLRREALAPFGGLVTGTITEDMHTSLALQAAGWKSVYLNELLVTGLAPMDFASYTSQRLRWAEGNLKILRYLNPLTCRGLSPAQRISYFASMFHWTIGFAKLVFYLAPPLILFTGRFPIVHFDRTFLLIYGAHLASLVASYKLLSGGTGRLLMDEVFNMANFFTQLVAAKRFLFGRGSGTFVVTAKRGSADRQESAAIPQFLLIAFTLLSLVWSALGLGFGATEDLVGAGVATFWAVYNLLLTVAVVGFALRPQQTRQAVRFRTAVPVEIARDGGEIRVGVTHDISESGCSLLWPTPIEAGSQLSLRLHFGRQVIAVRGEVRASYGRRDSQWVGHGVEFVDLDRRTVDRLADAIYNMAVPQLFTRLSRPTWLVRQWRMARRLGRGAWPRPARREAYLPLRVTHAGGEFLATTRDVSAGGVSLVAPRALAAGQRVRVRLLSGDDIWVQTATVTRALPVRAARTEFALWDVGLRLDGADAGGFEPIVAAAAEAA